MGIVVSVAVLLALIIGFCKLMRNWERNAQRRRAPTRPPTDDEMNLWYMNQEPDDPFHPMTPHGNWEGE